MENILHIYAIYELKKYLVLKSSNTCGLLFTYLKTIMQNNNNYYYFNRQHIIKYFLFLFVY